MDTSILQGILPPLFDNFKYRRDFPAHTYAIHRSLHSFSGSDFVRDVGNNRSDANILAVAGNALGILGGFSMPDFEQYGEGYCWSCEYKGGKNPHILVLQRKWSDYKITHMHMFRKKALIEAIRKIYKL